ncbi:MAG: undecaprenyl-phosphate glucose phosphotransferase [Pseudomonadota bacterium]|nr:undecaprenyl-phosphate glucose phosphotransferase [Pseudomonadota bacterium]
MFDTPQHKAFFSAPQSVTSFVAALLEPGLTILTFIGATLWIDPYPQQIPSLTLCMFVLALTFPGRNRFRDNLLGAAVDILQSWLILLSILALFGIATRTIKIPENELQYFDQEVLLTWGVLTPILQWLSTAIGAFFLKRHHARPGSRRKAVVVGAGPLGAKVSNALDAGDVYGAEFVGYFDDRLDGRVDAEARGQVLGNLADIARYVVEHNIREVYITLPLGSQPRIQELCEKLQRTTASLFFVPDVFGISIIQGRLQDMNGVPVVGILETPFTGTNELAKRLSDIVLASVILVVISPLLVVLAIGVKLSSPGPVIFRQRRNGLDGGEITVYKFRSMTTQDDGPEVKQATRDDPRVTPLGAFIRRNSLDELPQFFNVLQGRMSIVGPRPHAVTHNEQYRQIIKAYMVRHKVKPGITGWAQINGHRGETDTVEKMRARVEYDLEYLRNWSLGLDLRIIASTIRLVFFDRHAY